MIRVICDNLSDINKDFARENNVIVLPTFYYFDENEIYGGEIELSRDEFFENLKTKRAFSSCINLGDTIDIFNKIMEDGDDIVYISFSSKLSSCYQVANMAKDEVDGEGRIFIIDSLFASYPLALMVEDVLNLIKEGKSANEIFDIMEMKKLNYDVVFTTNELDYLVRGGRLSPTSGAIGNLLSIKPILSFKDGGIFVLEKARGQGKSYQKLIDYMKRNNYKEDRVVVVYAYENDCKDRLLEMLEKEGIVPYHVGEIGFSIVTHLGPSGLGIIFEKRESEDNV